MSPGCGDAGGGGEGGEADATAAEFGTDEGDDAGDTGDTGDGAAELDSDEDGLSDVEEEMLGTDPNSKDTDEDNYWDSWEVWEGTDPLDLNSRIYQGFWPYYPNKDDLEQGSWATSTTATGSPFPRAEFLDQHGDSVDIYDFANFTSNETGEPSYMIIDMSAQWCGPCHNMANWIAGVDNAETASLQTAYPTVRDKVYSLRIWWITIIVEDAAGNPPTLSDSESWYAAHQDNHIPVLVDETQQVRGIYNGGQYPFFFLLEPELGVEFWGIPGPGDNPFLALFFVDQYL
ncbi:TlpA family protein disulfide reductase [Enhygromyxa salina]|uniref:TlpA family protein disulfide reductase n=1 Tax=Enhygromyxa salina TaxID=215803 RepID=UPI000D08C072|nr:hypothetical protein [Enhygromyxa salina]